MLLDSALWICTVALQLMLLFEIAQQQSIVKTLPGYDGPLPVKLETRYIGIGEKEEVQFFYYFMESERDPGSDPLLIWLCGGPGCSVVGPMLYQFGPFEIDVKASNNTFVQLRRRQYTWTKIANILFFDSPVGTGFSYSNTSEGYKNSDTETVKNNYQFIQKWLLAHPQFLSNGLYIGADSYAGKIAPPLVYEIVKGIEAGQEPKLALQGYLVGNPLTHKDSDVNWHVSYVNRMGLISDEYYKQAEESCGGLYVHPDPNNTACSLALEQINDCIRDINDMHILEPECNSPLDLLNYNPSFLRHADEEYDNKDDFYNGTELVCRQDLFRLSHVWANLPAVQEALHIREGTKERWARCNRTLDRGYKRDLLDVYPYHKLLTTKPIQALIYSGDHDLIFPHIGTYNWIQRLNLTLKQDWRSWVVDGQNAGYTVRYRNNEFYLTFATVKGGGHTPQEQRPKECLAMVDRWFSYYPL